MGGRTRKIGYVRYRTIAFFDEKSTDQASRDSRGRSEAEKSEMEIPVQSVRASIRPREHQYRYRHCNGSFFLPF